MRVGNIMGTQNYQTVNVVDPSSGALSANGISKSYLRNDVPRLVLADISFSARPQEVVCFVGPTGCGKTTLLNILAGFESPDLGEVAFEGRLVDGPGPDRGFVFQQANLFPWQSVYDNVAFALAHGRGLRVNTESKRDSRDRVNHYLNRMGLTDAADLYPYQISGGMKARAALARVMISNPPVLLMDEPFGALDALTRASMHKLMLTMMNQEEPHTVVLITHDVEEAALLADTVFVMSMAPARLANEFTVPFGNNRDYEEILRSVELAEFKALIRDTLQPFLGQ